MTKHLLGITLAVPLLAGAAPQQQQPNQPNRSPFQPIPIILQPNQPKTNTLPKPPPSKTGFEAPKRTTTPTPNPSVSPSARSLGTPLDMSDWTKVTPSTTGLTFFMPEEPNEEKRTIKVGERDLNLVEYVYSLSDDKGALTLMYSDLPKSRRTTDSRILDAARDRVVKDLDGKLTNEDKVRLGDVSGLEISVKSGNGNYVRQRLFIKGDRLYQAIAAGPSGFVKSTEVDTYMKSLKFGTTAE